MWRTATTRSVLRVELDCSSASTSHAAVLRRQISPSRRRTLATETEPDASPEIFSQPPKEPDSPRALTYTLFTSLILARAPLLTPTPTPFESAYYNYQARIHRALSTPFPSEFYFKKGTLLERRFQAEERARERAAFGEGFEGEEGAEVLDDVPSEEDEVHPLPRIHESDRTGDVKDLNRQGERNLYLLVQSKDDKSWRFPFWKVGLEQPLHKTAQAGLVESFGPNMNTWMVSRQPIGFVRDSVKSPSKTFFFKGRVLAGRPMLAPDSPVSQLAWLAKEEIEDRVDPTYWTSIRDLLPRV